MQEGKGSASNRVKAEISFQVTFIWQCLCQASFVLLPWLSFSNSIALKTVINRALNIAHNWTWAWRFFLIVYLQHMYNLSKTGIFLKKKINVQVPFLKMKLQCGFASAKGTVEFKQQGRGREEPPTLQSGSFRYIYL